MEWTIQYDQRRYQNEHSRCVNEAGREGAGQTRRKEAMEARNLAEENGYKGRSIVRLETGDTEATTAVK